MKWWYIVIIVVILVIILYYFRRNIIRKIKTLQSPYKYFTYDEFDSPDEAGSGEKYMDREVIRKLDIARDCAGFPFIIVSGYRTKKHNKDVGGVDDSSHTRIKGTGVDIDYTTKEEMNTILRCLVKVGFNRYGIRLGASGSSIHIDSDTTKKQFIYWGYEDKKGNYISPPNPWIA